MQEQSDTKNWRKIVLRTDGLKWMIDSNETNSSMLELLEICREMLKYYRRE